jgi:hypothetical protein
LAAWSPAGVCFVAAALVGAAAAAWWAVQQGGAASRPGPATSPGPDAFGRPEAASRAHSRPVVEPWVLIVAALAIAAIVVVPRLIGISFLLLPIVFGRRGRRRPPGFPRRDDPGHGGNDSAA